MPKRELALGGLVKHLGLQMYMSPTRAIAELISNAGDAGAPEVHITIHLNLAFSEGSVIDVFDTGPGMTFEECEYND